MAAIPEEPLLAYTLDCFCMFPIKYPAIWEMFKKAQASLWTIEEVDVAQDMYQWTSKLTANERRFINHVLIFSAALDGIVLENLSRVMSELQVPEAWAFCGFQIAMKSVHSEMYSVLIDSYIIDETEKQRLFTAIEYETIPFIGRKADWTLRWIDASESFTERIAVMACVEGIFFSSSFCAIVWLKKQGLMLGLTFANDMIS